MLDFIRDIYTSFRQTSLERIKSPFLGAFVFSWVGFNWQMLAILIFSKKEIEERLSIINKSHDIGDYLLAPIFTTALLVIILPQINKLITKIQSKPNAEIIQLSLTSKIDIANLQQQLAESEARKKLAEKKEERFIEENIVSIQQNYTKAQDDLKDRESEISTLLKGYNDLQGQFAKAESKLKVEQEAKKQTQNELTIEKENNRILGDQIINLTSDINKYKSEISMAKDAQEKTLSTLNALHKRIKITEQSIRRFNLEFPSLVDIKEHENAMVINTSSYSMPLLKNANVKVMNLKKGKTIENDNA